MENNNPIKRICVFCGSNFGDRSTYKDAAKELGKALAARGIGLVYGGGGVGLMGVIAKTVMQEKGEVTGVIPKSLFAREIALREITELYEVASMHERKALMAQLSDAFIAMPGGYGTLDEFFEIVTWSQLGLHAKPIGILNVEGYFDLLLEFVDHVIRERFAKPEHGQLILRSDDPEDLLQTLIQRKSIQPTVKLIDWKES
ncbi:MAG: TIGR00730 family Rossman fold protein [Candidatus Kuenenia sp.]|nr:TIGR00730 family Rossman fold protein [Candidatus Kuenenia hertensis]